MDPPNVVLPPESENVSSVLAPSTIVPLPLSAPNWRFPSAAAISSVAPGCTISPVEEEPNVPAPLTSSQTGSYDQTIYFKASKFLAGLRSRMGTTAFFAAMRELFTANRNGVLTTKEFVAAMRRHGAPYSYLDAFLRL